jgi:hypothetical protein
VASFTSVGFLPSSSCLSCVEWRCNRTFVAFYLPDSSPTYFHFCLRVFCFRSVTRSLELSSRTHGGFICLRLAFFRNLRFYSYLFVLFCVSDNPSCPSSVMPLLPLHFIFVPRTRRKATHLLFPLLFICSPLIAQLLTDFILQGVQLWTPDCLSHLVPPLHGLCGRRQAFLEGRVVESRRLRTDDARSYGR